MTPELNQQKFLTLYNMVNYMKYGGAVDEDDPEYDPNFNAGYSQKHVERCSKIIDEYFASLDISSGEKPTAEILKAVEVTVIQLNKLNDECSGSLIETNEREDLCELITRAAELAGLEQSGADITEQWREW